MRYNTIAGVLAACAAGAQAQTTASAIDPAELAEELFPEALASSSINPTQLARLSSDLVAFSSSFLAANPEPTILTGDVDIVTLFDPASAPIPTAVDSALAAAFPSNAFPTNAAEASSYLNFFSGLPQSSAVAEFVSAWVNFEVPAANGLHNIIASDLGISVPAATITGSMATMAGSMATMTGSTTSSPGMAAAPTHFVLGAVAAAAGVVGMAMM